MTRKALLPSGVLAVALLACAAPVRAADPIDALVDKVIDKVLAFDPVDYTVAKVIDAVIDGFIIDPALQKLGLRPDVAAMEQRLRVLEENTALKSEVREEIKKLRERIDQSATKDDLKTLETQFHNNLRQIERRLDRLEDRSEWLEVKVEDQDKGTKLSQDADHFVYRGQHCLEKEDYFLALANARVASKLDEKKPEPYLLQGKIYAAMGAKDVARTCYDQAIKVAPQHAPAYQIRADARLGDQDFTGAVEDYSEALRIDPKDSWSWGGRGRAHIALQQYDDAVQDCCKALEINIDNADARFDRGRAYHLSGNNDRAVDDFEAYLRAKPDDARGHDMLGYARFRKGDFDGAQGSLEKARSLDDKDGEVCAHLSEFWTAKGDTDKALDFGAQAVNLAPNAWASHFHYGVALKKAEKPDEALEQFKQAAGANPDNVENGQVRAYGNCGLIYYNKHDYDGAIEYLTYALNLKPEQKTVDGTPLLTFRARAYNEKENYDQAIEDATAALKIEPNDANAYFYRAYAHSEKKEHNEAIADYSEVVRLDPKDAGTFNNRGIEYEAAGDTDKAIDDYSEAIRLDPQHKFAYRNRAECYRKQGKTDAAVDDFVKALDSPDDSSHEAAVSNLIELAPNNAALLKALPADANANGVYSSLLRRLYVPGDEDSYGKYDNYGYSSSSSYGGYDGLPAGYWVYVAPYWYIWDSK